MEWMVRIRSIERRAAMLNLTSHELCSLARVPHSTFWRMQQPDANPRVRTVARVLGRLELYLDKREAALRRQLARTSAA